jgi:hypothetical protein
VEDYPPKPHELPVPARDESCLIIDRIRRRILKEDSRRNSFTFQREVDGRMENNPKSAIRNPQSTEPVSARTLSKTIGQ